MGDLDPPFLLQVLPRLRTDTMYNTDNVSNTRSMGNFHMGRDQLVGAFSRVAEN